ncbi:hypothetical protein FRAHR75_670028 [Frankia sp. Hr75.2]|nr:hypothetical protein FRAHR75_670028 [Frankia sp. Hr75.2]
MQPTLSIVSTIYRKSSLLRGMAKSSDRKYPFRYSVEHTMRLASSVAVFGRPCCRRRLLRTRATHEGVFKDVDGVPAIPTLTIRGSAKPTTHR